MFISMRTNLRRTIHTTMVMPMVMLMATRIRTTTITATAMRTITITITPMPLLGKLYRGPRPPLICTMGGVRPTHMRRDCLRPG